jgi:hypothetical protein
VRGEVLGGAAGELLASQVLEALNLSLPAGFDACYSDESAPVYFGVDKRGRHQWSFNVELAHAAG